MSLVAKILRTLIYLAIIIALLYPVYLAFTDRSFWSVLVIGIVVSPLILLVLSKLVLEVVPEPPDEEFEEEAIAPVDLLEQFEAVRDAAWGTAKVVLAEHADELHDQPKGERRMELLLLWRRAIQERAHEYDDLLAGHVNLEQMAELHSEAIMIAWSLGYAAARGWIDEYEAEVNISTLSRTLRDQVGNLDFEIYELEIDLPLVMDETLAEIAALGQEDGRAVN